MKILHKGDIKMLAVCAGVGILTGLIYVDGKLAGKCDAYAECTDIVNTAIENLEETIDNVFTEG